MEKDRTILEIIERLTHILGPSTFEVEDYWEADLCAVGVKIGLKLVYISTYKYLDLVESQYDCHFELLNEYHEDEYTTVKIREGVSETELIHEIRTFWEI